MDSDGGYGGAQHFNITPKSTFQRSTLSQEQRVDVFSFLLIFLFFLTSVNNIGHSQSSITLGKLSVELQSNHDF